MAGNSSYKSGEKPPPSASHGPGLAVINAGPFKTGTASMAEAYRILGFKPHHGLELMDKPEQWAALERAAEATWPDAPGVRRRRRDPSAADDDGNKTALFTRADWDAVFAGYGAVTDVAALFADQLSAAYPESKVVIVKRDASKWERSFETQIIQPIWGPLGWFIYHTAIPITGNRAMDAMKKMCFGHWRARSAAELRANARLGYEAYYDRIREVVPEGRRLEYTLGSGWEPLCAFLGVDVPQGVEFPRLNGQEAHSEKQMEQAREIMGQAALVVLPWVAAAVVLGAGALWARTNSVI